MEIKPFMHIIEVDELFEKTLALDVHSEDTAPLNEIVKNFTGETQAYYVTVESAVVDELALKADEAIGVLYQALDHFMESDDPDKFAKLGITNNFLIGVINDSYHIDDYLAKIHPKLPNFSNGIYGNFDATVDMDGKVWFYEYNGNTPVMAYESIVIQDMALNKLGVNSDAQFNHMFEHWVTYFESMFNEFGALNIAMSGFSELVCDLLTIDIIANAATQAGHKAIVVDLRVDIELDHLTNTLHLKGEPEIIDYLFTLYPWEEYDDDSLIAFRKNYETLRRTGKGTLVSEPAYKVVMSNKAFLAYVYEYFADEALSAGIIPTYMTHGEVNTTKYVEKPVFGRLSCNIKVYDSGVLVNETDGAFNDDISVYQPFIPLISTGIAGNLQYRIWMAPNESYDFEACGFAVRKSNSVYSMATESEEFLPHVISEDNDEA